VDFVHPVQAVIPGAQGRILAVLANVSTDLTLRTIARLSGLSPAQVSRVLPRLVGLGMVDRRDVPPAALFRLEPSHVAARAVLAIARTRDSVVADLQRTAAALEPAPVSMVLFGSFARGDATAQSDIDVLVVRPALSGPDESAFDVNLERWREEAARLTGNRVETTEVGEDEVPDLITAPRSFWDEVAQDSIVIAGKPLPKPSGDGLA
jgi:DNA-binding transcriptional ArsR family regulator